MTGEVRPGTTVAGESCTGEMSEERARWCCVLQAKRHSLGEEGVARQSLQNNQALGPFPKSVNSSPVTPSTRGKFT